MFIAALIIMTKEGKQSKFPSPDEWINKWYIHTMKYNSAIKSNELPRSRYTLLLSRKIGNYQQTFHHLTFPRDYIRRHLDLALPRVYIFKK